jgi:hypothetical protein
MTRGQCGTLNLHRKGLAPSTSCRSPGAPVHPIKKGVCPNPHGRGKRRDLKVAEILNKVLNAKTEFRERGKLKKASRIELSIRRFAALATKGDVASAAWLLKMRVHAKKYGDSGPTIIRVAGGFPEALR